MLDIILHNRTHHSLFLVLVNEYNKTFQDIRTFMWTLMQSVFSLLNFEMNTCVFPNLANDFTILEALYFAQLS